MAKAKKRKKPVKRTTKRSSTKGGKNMASQKSCSPCPSTCILRVTLGFVFLYASITKLFFGAAPPVDLIITFMPADISLFLLGLVEFAVGVMLILGLFTRVAGWMAVSLFGVFMLSAIYLSVSGSVEGIWNGAMLFKDIGLIGASIAIALQGSQCCSLDTWIAKRAKK
jgi:uncharacterized membrane protein YphA (DoxX/SURF4 family)